MIAFVFVEKLTSTGCVKAEFKRKNERKRWLAHYIENHLGLEQVMKVLYINHGLALFNDLKRIERSVGGWKLLQRLFVL